MSYLKGLWRSRNAAKADAAPAPEPPTGPRLAWDPNLLERLHDRHQQLRALADNLEACVAAQRFDEVRPLLRATRKLLQAHFQEENSTLYAYLHQQLAGNPECSARVAATHDEMGRLGKTTLGLIRHFEAADVSAANQAEYLEASKSIRSVLSGRMKHEEEVIFALYQPPAAPAG